MTETADKPVPTAAVLGALVLVAGAVAVAALGHYGGIGRTVMPEAAAVAVKDLRFEDRGGAVAVLDADTGAEVAQLAPGTNGFIRGVLRGLARERRMSGTGREPPFQLVRRADGRLTLVDPTTGRRIELDAFGPTNAEAFAKLLQPGEKHS
ncbi:photosynthetic complex assembly protein PuhC [Prosthecomicrobium sp. N25]|uniref:photosynthetic complex assembly protein PuhC n=1 Tax=Prosthecomicrobium sp. N25 TaxID=3129254 RepID=UPI00307838FB